MKAASITVLININLLLIRYILLDINDKLVEGLIFQLPWWDLPESLREGKFWQWR